MTQEVERVLSQVKRRQNLRALGRATFVWTVGSAAVYAVLLCGARLLSLWPDWFAAWTIALVPAAGLLAGFVMHRRSSLLHAARSTDAHQRTEDLFLTSLDLPRAPGRYQELVADSARAAAGKVRPDEVAPLPFGGRAAQAVLALGILWCAAMYLPAFDPFQSESERVLLGRQRERLAEERKSTEQRKKELAAKRLDQPNSAEVAKALKEVVRTFRALRRNQRSANDKRLGAVQREIADRRFEVRSGNRRHGVSTAKLQGLGKIGSSEKTRGWGKDLSRGKTESLRRELRELRDALKKMAESTDAAEREKLRKQIEERTKDLADFLESNASSKELSETLAKALNQLQALATPKVAKDAMRALQKTLELSELELKNLAQSLRDMQALEQALKALQAARKANAKGAGKEGSAGKGQKGGKRGKGDQGLDGEDTPDLGSLEEYEKYYEKLLLELGEQEGPGMGGPGRGRGGTGPEDPSQKSDFKTEKSRSALLAGKLLMTLKTKEVGDKGEVKQKYAAGVEQVKQGVGEAIRQERVPPGYHEAIRKYFDNLGKDGPSGMGTAGKRTSGKGDRRPAKGK